MRWLLPLFIFFIFFLLVNGRLSQEEQNQILDLHNQYRANVNPKATNMEKMYWSKQLEATARKYASTCPGAPSEEAEEGAIGENLAWAWPSLTVEGVMKEWGGEGSNYDYSTDSCTDGKDCSHYKQMIMATSHFVGCAVQKCKGFSFAPKRGSGMLLVCHYMVDQSILYLPYMSGDNSCSTCPPSWICSGALCTNPSWDQSGASLMSPGTSTNPVSVNRAERSSFQVGVVDLYGSNGCDYTAAIIIKNQTYNMIIDSGSSNFAVVTTSCSECSGLSPQYSGALTTNQVGVQYGSGSISGDEISSLPFSIGGISASMDVLGIVDQTDFFTCGNQAQGIIGMAFSPLSEGGLPVMMDVLANAGVPNGFALQLCAGLSGGTSGGKTGNLWIGGYDTQFTSGAMKYISIVDQEWYNVQINSITVAGKAVSLSSINNPQSILDSGTTQIVFNTQSNYQAVINAIQNSGAAIFHSVSSAEEDAFWGGTGYLSTPSQVTINGSFQMSIEFAGPSGTVSISIPTQNIFTLSGESVSFSGFGYQSKSDQSTIIGETLFLNYVVFFERTSAMRIGFAPGTQCFTQTSASGINSYPEGTNIPAGAPTASPSDYGPIYYFNGFTIIPPSANATFPGDPFSSTTTIIIGVVVGALVLFLLIGCCSYCCSPTQRRMRLERRTLTTRQGGMIMATGYPAQQQNYVVDMTPRQAQAQGGYENSPPPYTPR